MKTFLCHGQNLFFKKKKQLELKDQNSLNTGKGEETKLILGCRQKTRESQELLYKRYYGYVMAISLSYGSNREVAQEIVDDAFMKVFDTILSFDIKQSFKPWLRRITINTAIDYLRKNKKFNYHLSLAEEVSEMQSLEMIDSLVVKDIHKLIAELPDALKVVFNLYEIEGYSHREIAEIMGISESSSRTYLTRGKERLRDLMAKHFN